MQYSDLKGAGGEWLLGHKDKWVKDGDFVALLMNGDVSSHTSTVSNTQDQLQLSQIKANDKFHEGNVEKYETGFSLEMTLVLDSKSTELSLHLSVYVSVCLFPLSVL